MELGIYKISDITSETGKILPFLELQKKYDFDISNYWLLYNSVCKAIPVYWRIILSSNDELEAPDRILYNEIVDKPKCSAFLYNYLITNNKHNIYKYYVKFVNMCEAPLEFKEYTLLFKHIYTCTKEVKLMNFQYHLMLGKIFTKDILFKWKIVPSDTCELCHNVKQTVAHLLFDYDIIRPLWLELGKIFEIQNVTLWNKANILCNKVHPGTTTYLMWLL